MIFGNGQKSSYIPSGWMGKTEAIKLDEKSTNDPKTGPHCMQLEFISAHNFGGIVWQSPADDWGDKPGGHDLTGATALKFWARGSNGGETVEFKYGIIGEDKPFHDSSTGAIVVTLDEEWKEYSIDLHGKDMSMIKTGFVWVVAGQGAPIKFFLDEIRYE
ncbi:MAG TPA: hypothetical protein PK402_02445 [Tepidisphaeraceae bacterium]|nr:hypothetical protein [Tepidisphaeraceae bacterium]